MTVRRLDLRLLEQCDMMAETAARTAKDLDNPAIKLDHHIAQDELVHAHHYACGVCQDLALSRPAGTGPLRKVPQSPGTRHNRAGNLVGGLCRTSTAQGCASSTPKPAMGSRCCGTPAAAVTPRCGSGPGTSRACQVIVTFFSTIAGMGAARRRPTWRA